MSSKLIEKLIEASNKNYSVIFGPICFIDGFSVRVRNENWKSVYQFRSINEVTEDTIIKAIDKCINDIEEKKLIMKGLII